MGGKRSRGVGVAGVGISEWGSLERLFPLIEVLKDEQDDRGLSGREKPSQALGTDVLGLAGEARPQEGSICGFSDSNRLDTLLEINIAAVGGSWFSIIPYRPGHKNRTEGSDISQQLLCCFECCIKCLGGVPYASLVATILCFSGVALFCGCGHVALAGTVAILEQHFSTNTSDHALLSEVIQLVQYVIYGIASFFFLYGIILLAEGFYTTSAVKELHGEFKTTACGRCISGMFVFLTYVLGVAWLGVFGFSAVPVFMFYNIWSTCEVIRSPQTNGTAGVEQICVDIRQYGIIPWNAFPGKICGSALENICNTNEFYVSYHLFIVACAGAGATVIALIHFLMILSSNWAYLKDASKMQACQDIKAKEEQELQDIQSRSKEQLNSYT
ncbi:neuronal membrane glycoprotein M6-b isoform X3 [Prionailurus iriomotensis]